MTDSTVSPVRGSAAGWPLVLYFHHVHDRIDHYTSLTPSAFRRGLETVLEEYGPAADPGDCGTGEPGDTPRFLVTFDDGYRDVVDHALPVLDDLGVRTIQFLISGVVGQRDEDPRHCHMGWDDARALRAAGHVIGAHTVSHRALDVLPAAEQTHEIEQSVTRVRTELCHPGAIPLAYPYGVRPTVALPAGLTAFGTVKSAPRPWVEAPADIRRTYLPTHEPDTWVGLARGWREQWDEGR